MLSTLLVVGTVFSMAKEFEIFYFYLKLKLSGSNPPNIWLAVCFTYIFTKVKIQIFLIKNYKMAEFCCIAAGSAVVGKCTQILVEPLLELIWNRITRVFKSGSNVKTLKEKAGKLVAEKQRVLQFTKAAERRGEEAALNVMNWLTSAEKCIGEREKLGDAEDKAKKKCFAGLCPNPRARYQISKKVEEYLEAVAPLLEEAAGSGFLVAYPLPPKEISTGAAEGFEQFESRMPTLNRVMGALRSASVHKIGICGLPGVGKTTLAKEVARQAEDERLFNVIVMASVKKNPVLKEIQGEIADKLGLQLHGETEFGRASQLKEHLKKKKKILVILDDIWARLDLDQLGIPYEDKKNEASSIGEEKMQYENPHTSRDHDVVYCDLRTHENTRRDLVQPKIPFEDKKNEASSTREEKMQCKILLTSRDRNVLSCHMGTHENIQIGTLQDEEAWTLLKKIVGDEVENSELQLTAKEIAEKCAGLPLAVEVVAKALKGKDAHVWRDALLQLQRPCQESFTGIPANVYKAIRLSYYHLEGKELQQSFLLCSLFGRNSSIEDLLTYGIGLGLFPAVKTIGEARDRVLTLVSNLKSSSLLLDGRSSSMVNMHDLVHDVAISIALTEHHLLSIAEDYIPKEWSDREELERFKWFSLQYANINELPDELKCPQLTLFSLHSKDPSMKIPENFFQGTQKLRVLDFTNMCFSSLPSSICLLKNLHTLHVNGSVLEDLAIIGKLTSLEVLSLSRSDIVEVPTEIGQLTQLKLLDLRNCTKLKMIQPHVLASLSKLEELYLGNSFDQWDVGDDGNQTNASLAELKDLHYLAALDVHVCDMQFIPEDLFSERLERFKIFIGDVGNRWESSFNNSKILKLELNTSISSNHSIGMLLKKTEELHLQELKGVKNVVYELDVEGFKKLRSLYIHNAPEVQHIINLVECAFPMLEQLFLWNLNNLVKICPDSLRATSFGRLTIITVEFCTELKNLFPFSVARRLLQLKEIRVMQCRNIVEIVDDERQGGMEIAEANDKFELVKLRSLHLQYLPNFIRFCHANEETNGSSSNPAPLFHEKIVFPNLEELQLYRINIKRIWGSQLFCIQSLTKLIIEGCDYFEHLLSSSMAKSLVQLRCLEIKKCRRMREIIELENAEEMEDLFSFPKLDFLYINDLENLTRFCSGNCSVKFTSLKQLWIYNCPEMKGFTINHDITDGLEPLFNEKAAFPSLEELNISRLKKLRSIWNHQPPADSFCKLKSLLIEYCAEILTTFPSGILRRLCTSIERLVVAGCGSLEEIFGLGEVEESDAVVDTQLRRLQIHYLPRLKHVWTKDPQGILTFRNLQSVTVKGCPNLQNIFPASVAMGLQQLEELRLSECGIQEIVAFRADIRVPRFVFTSVSNLCLWYLRRLRYFYPQEHVTEWPALKEFEFYGCGTVNKVREERHLGKFPVQLPTFSIEKVIPRLEKLSLDQDDIAMISSRQFRGDLFSKVKSLELFCFHNEPAVFPVLFLERFLNLEELFIGCSSFKDLFPSAASIDCQEKQVGRHFHIRKLRLDCLSQLKYIWSQDSGQDPLFQNVESLEVTQCDGLISLSKSTASFQNLTTLLVEECQGLRSLFLFATAKSWEQLQTMTIKECHLLTEIVGDEGNGLEDVIVFSKLKVLKLQSLTRLESFCSGKFTFMFPLLEQVMTIQCPNFETFCHGVLRTPMLRRIQLTEDDYIGGPVVDLNATINHSYKEKLGYSGLQHLKLFEFPKLMEIWNGNPQEILDFRRLSFLEICNCGNLRYLLTPSMGLNLIALQEMKVENCKMMEQIITEEAAMEVAENKIIFPLLATIELKSCSNLKSFYMGSYKLECPSLDLMDVHDCPKMGTFSSAFSTVQMKEAANGGSEERIGKEDIDVLIEPFFSGQVEFSSFLLLRLSLMNMQQIFNKQLSSMSSVTQSVGDLFLVGCSNLKYLFTSSMIKSFGQLKGLQICDCKMMKEVIVTEGLAEEMMLFPNLRKLKLECLPKLTRFCSGNYSVFPSLAVLGIFNCPLLETFISSSTIGETSHMTTSKRIENAYKSPLFDEKVAFPFLKELAISGLENLRIVWHHQLPADSFSKLKSLVIRNCGKLLTIFAYDTLGRLSKSLEVLMVRSCSSLEEIFELGEINTEESHAVLDTLLRELTIENLPRLRHVWSKDPRGILSFRNLQSVRAMGCPNLQNMFPASVAMEFQQLEKLMLHSCGIEEVVAFGGEEAVPRFVFSCLSTLHLWNLSRLKCFYPGKHVTEWPMLQKFRAYHFEGIKETNVESLGAFPVQLPLFTLEKVVPRMKKLSLTSDDIAMICNRQFPEDLFSNVKGLCVLCYHDESADFPFRFIERFFNLEKLFIGCSSFKELFPSVASIDCQKKDVGWQLRIRKLTLDALPYVKYIWNQGSQSTASFRNLTTLFVTRCQNLRNLFSSTTAQSLVQLQTIRIEECNLLGEIVGDEGDGLEDVIVFSKLKVLKLKCLIRLASFCSANFTFKFPLLEEVMVVQCPNFETFCHGVVRTPSLQKIQLTEEDNMWHPVVELNNTINQLYKEMAGYAGLQELNLSDFPQLMEIWYKNPQEILDFKQLRELEICNCGNLTYLLTPSMALSLVTLERLKVQNSEMMEHIITEEGTIEADEKMIFPRLEAINLESCSNLTSFCVGNYKLVFPSLAAMEVIDCPEMVTFASTFSTVQVKEAAEGESAERIRKEDIDPTEPFFSDQVSFPGLMLLVIHGMGSLNMICDNQLDADSFYRLQKLWVASCENLLNIFPITMLGRLQNLDVLEIRNCVSLEKIFQHQGPSAGESQALKSSQSTMVETAINFVLPKVRRLILVGLPNLKSLYPQMHTTEWPSLEKLVVFRCNQVQILASELLSYQRTSEETQLKSQNEHSLFWINKATFPSLEELIVQRNDSMKVIWYSDDVKDGILFSKLETLKLKALPRLESICSGSCNFEFPSLKDVLVMACPNMQTFCKGEESTPKLQKVKLTEDEDEGCWEDGVRPRTVVCKIEG